MENFLYVFSMILQIAMLIFGGYYTVISLVGCLFKKEPKCKNETNITHKFAMVVSAHDEEVVIGNLVDSLQSLNYPKDSYEVFVIADNCSDSTADISRQHGATVYERTDDVKKGKGYALDWMFEKIFAMDKHFDAICVFDADNLVHPEFLNQMNRQFNRGYKAVQGYIDTKNPYDSWISMSYAISFWSINRTFQYARYALGMCCQLCGTGFAVATDIIKDIGWGATCLAEDMEFTMKLTMNNYKVGWAHDAIVYDEKPLTFSQSYKQRVRWMQGHADVLSRFFAKLIKKGVKERKLIPIDCACYLFQPIRLVALFYITVMGILQTFFPDGNLGFFQMTYLFSTPLIWNTIVLCQLLFTPTVLFFEKKLNWKVIKGYIPYYFYTFTWFPISVVGILKKNNKEWFHTQHTRTISLTDIEK
ncbi:MAG: glycosyltransferase family 2 protein [Clostridia bacterium]|nr:glycosyltransferase family 2 protein [Clostridia bacterium]